MEEISLLYNNKKFCLKMRPETKHPKELKELKGTSLAKRRKEVIMQTFPCFMQSVPTCERKSGNALKGRIYGSPKCRTTASTSGFRKVCRRAL